MILLGKKWLYDEFLEARANYVRRPAHWRDSGRPVLGSQRVAGWKAGPTKKGHGTVFVVPRCGGECGIAVSRSQAVMRIRGAVCARCEWSCARCAQ